MREALAALDMLGVVSIRPGSGTYLRGSASELLPQTLSWGLMLGEQRTRELIELRSGLEVQAAELAAERADREHIADLAAHLAGMRGNVGDLERFVQADRDFQISRSARRRATSCCAICCRTWSWSLRCGCGPKRILRDRGPGPKLYVRRARTAVFSAIRDHDPAAAGRAMATHMESAGARLLHAFEVTSAGPTAPMAL